MRSTLPRRRRIAAFALSALPVTAVARRVEQRVGAVLVVNFHSVPPRLAPAFGELLDLLTARYEIGDPGVLGQAAREGVARPTAFLTFDDGIANHAEVVAPLLEERGLRAVFAVPVGFLESPPADALRWFRRHVYPTPTELHQDHDIRAMSWLQLAGLAARGHTISSHGWHHQVLGEEHTRAELECEVVASRERLEEMLPGVAVSGFCWPVCAASAGSEAARLVGETYSFALGGENRLLKPPHDPQRIYRVNLEAGWPRRSAELQMVRAAARLRSN